MGSVSVQHKMDETELPWRIKPSDEKRPPADASPEQFPVLREVRFRPKQTWQMVDGGVSATVDVAISFQCVLCRSHHVGGFHRGPGVCKRSGQDHFMKNLE